MRRAKLPNDRDQPPPPTQLIIYPGIGLRRIWQRGTIFDATFYRIHDNPKPVQNISSHGPAKPHGSDEPLVHPPVGASKEKASQRLVAHASDASQRHMTFLVGG